MKILFISQHKYPHIGGVEKHIDCVIKELDKRDFEIKTISEQDIKYPKIKVVGLFLIWYWLFKNRKLISDTDIVHIHDVFIWYIPFKFIFPSKKVFATFHGWEGIYPIPFWNILNKKIASKLSNGSIAVGKYIEKYYGIKAKYIIHGAVEKINKIRYKKVKNTICYLGRLDKDTGILNFFNWIKNNKKNFKITFVGDGTLKNECEKYGVVVGNIKNVDKYLKDTEIVVPSGYLSFLEAKNYNCKILTFASNPLKDDYWREIRNSTAIPTWFEVTQIYQKLWKSDILIK